MASNGIFSPLELLQISTQNDDYTAMQCIDDNDDDDNNYDEGEAVSSSHYVDSIALSISISGYSPATEVKTAEIKNSQRQN